MAINFDKVESHVRRLIKPTLYSFYVQSKPLLYVLAGSSIAAKDKLGDPNMGIVWGGAGIGRAKLKQQAGSYQHEFRFQSSQSDATESVGIDDSTPHATVFVDDLTEVAAIRWTDFWTAIRIRKDRLDAAKGDLAIGALIDDAMAFGFNRQLEKHQSDLWTGTLDEAGQNAEVWSTYLGLQHATDGTGTDFYGGKSRATFDQLRGKEYASTVLATNGAIAASSTKPLLRMFRHMKTDNASGGITNRYANAGSLAITTAALWNVLANEAEGNHTIYDSNTKIPGLMHDVGMKYPVIVKDTTMITYDPDCPSGEAYLLTPEFMVFEVEAGNNFVVEPFQKKWLNDEGGKKYVYAPIHAKTRLVSYRNDLNVKITGLTVT